MGTLTAQLERNKKLPILFVVGNATDVSALGKLQQAIEIHRGVTNTMLDVKGFYGTSFGTFSVSDKLRESISAFGLATS